MMILIEYKAAHQFYYESQERVWEFNIHHYQSIYSLFP